MNCLIILPDELISEREASISSDRIARVLDKHDLKEGITVSAAVMGGRRGQATVQELTEKRLLLEVNLSKDPLERVKTELIVAAPRPQTIKKVLHIAATMGLFRIHFIRTQNVVKSYFQSKMLEEGNIQSEILKGLEQSGDSIPPKVMIHRFFKPFISEYLPDRLTETGGENSMRLIADTRAEELLTSETFPQSAVTEQTAFLAIGPESGWSENEVEQFIELGFHPFTLGERILRVETALTYLLGQVDLIRRS